MKYTVVAALFVTLAAAQSADDIPSCAKPCLDDAVKKNTRCSNTDYACICPHMSQLQGDATGCVISNCGADVAVGKVLPAVEALCKAVGSAPASSAAPASSSAPASSAPASSAPATSAPATTTAAPVTTSWTSVPCDSTSVASHTHSGNGTAPTSTTVPVAGAAGLSVGAAAIALAALAL